MSRSSANPKFLQLCDPCFLTVMWYRLNSVFLPDSDATDWLVEQYQDIQDICQISMPATVIRALPDYASAPNSTYLPPGTDPADTSDNTGSSNCTGQLIPVGSLGCCVIVNLPAQEKVDDCHWRCNSLAHATPPPRGLMS